jgi:hypothetical protein
VTSADRLLRPRHRRRAPHQIAPRMTAPNVRRELRHAAMFFVTDNVHGLPNERMKWVGDHHLVRQTPGIMNSLRGKAA